MIHGTVSAIEYFLPRKVLTTQDLSNEFPEWRVEKIEAKTGIQERHIAGSDEFASDLAVAASQKLFASGACAPADIDFLLYCTQSPDYFLPTTACIIQDRLGIPTTAGAYDFNLGCSGYIYGLGQAEGLIATGQASRVLLITAETYTKFIHSGDRSVRTIFGDAAAATLVQAVEAETPLIGPFVYGTDGSGAGNLIVPAGGMRQPHSVETAVASEDDQGNTRSRDNLFMNGSEIFNFTLSSVPGSIERLLKKSGLSLEQVDLFVFHQANKYMLEHLRKFMKLPPEKFVLAMSHCGNTVSSSIPIALKHAATDGRLRTGALVMLVGFGVGYSWGATLLRVGAFNEHLA
jgi:3-oxoacyl-[acyl-carrier-protein] synthase-3